jgi:predicted nucleotidyltransferase
MKERTALEGLKDRIIEALGENLVCIFLTGSRIRREERKDSDYDLAIIVSRIDEEVLNKLRSIFLGLTNYSVYVLDDSDLKILPRAQFLQFIHSRILYGDFKYPLPSKADVASYVNDIRRDCLDRIRHYLVLPHPHEKLAKALLPALKSTYLSLSYSIYKETCKLPKT